MHGFKPDLDAKIWLMPGFMPIQGLVKQLQRGTVLGAGLAFSPSDQHCMMHIPTLQFESKRRIQANGATPALFLVVTQACTQPRT